MWRDRTNLYLHHSLSHLEVTLTACDSYISYRQSYAHHPTKRPRFRASYANGFSSHAVDSDERRGLMSPGAFDNDGDAVIEMDLLPPRWADVQDEVTEKLKEITKKAAELDRLHSKHVLPGFDDEDVKKQEEAVIERMTQEITRGFHDCQRAIQRIEAMVRDAKQSGGVSKGDEIMARNIQISLASRVQDVSAAFRKKQSNYLKSKQISINITKFMNQLLTTVQNCVALVECLLPWIGLSPLPRTPIRIHPWSNPKQTSHFLSQHCSNLRKNV